MPVDNQLGKEQRKYIRLDSVFPVEFRLVSSQTKQFLSEWMQGFTNNISKGGLCLSVNNLKPELAQLLKDPFTQLSLEIEMPFTGNTINAKARVSWVKELASEAHKYLIGLNYEEINPRQNQKILRYARFKKSFIPSVLTMIVLLGAGLAVNSLINIKLIQGNKALVEQLIKIVQESSVAKQKVKELARGREDLQIKIQELQLRIQSIEEERQKLAEAARIEAFQESKRTEELNNLIGQLTKEKDSLQEQLIALQHKENTVTEELLRLDKRKVNLEQANLDKMYQWLKVHQNPRTGLVLSFEGDGDIANWAFIYDQSLVAQAYINFSDFERARKIFDFFNKRAERQAGYFLNAYYFNDGSPAEYVVHSGPNIWLGIAVAHYTKNTGDTRYLHLAEEIARKIMDLQNQDKDGGVRGGPNINWYSTEHNLDAYAFFNMLYKISGKSEYEIAANKVLDWLVKHTYDKTDIPVKRGKGDSTIATDTYAWSIAAIGPQKLEELGMNPDRIVEFAEQHCNVEVCYLRPEGQSLKIKGYDFAAQRNIARGAVISSEWTAQMALAFKIMADYYYKQGMVAKARSYALKADECLWCLSNMIISSPSASGQGESCVVYSTEEFVDTGHGWFTPKGKSTGCVAGTAWTLFAYYKYNPLELKD